MISNLRVLSEELKQQVFEVLDARIASALHRIIQNTLLRGRQIASLIYEYFRVTGANDSVENYADLFTVVLRNDDIQEFDSKWDEFYYQ